MYRARGSMCLKSRIPRVNGIVTARVTGNETGNAMPVGSFGNCSSSTVLLNSPISIMATSNGNAWLKDPNDHNLQWRSMDFQIKPILPIEGPTAACPQLGQTYKETGEYLPTSKKGKSDNSNINNHVMVKSVKKSFSEVLKGCTELTHQNPIQSPSAGILPSVPVPVSVSTSASASTESGTKYVFDTTNPSAFESHSSAFTFGDFDNFEEELQKSIPIRNPRNPPCEQKVPCVILEEEFPSKHLSASVGGGDMTSLVSLEELLRQRIQILRAGQLSVNQLYILDLIEDLLAQHEALMSDGPPYLRRAGFLGSEIKNQQLIRCLESPNTLEQAADLLKVNGLGGLGALGHFGTIKTIDTDKTNDVRVVSDEDQHRAKALAPLNITPKLSEQFRAKPSQPPIDEDSILFSPLTNALIAPVPVPMKKRTRATLTVAEAIRNGEKVKVEVELQLHQRLFEIREIRPMDCTDEPRPALYFMKEIRVIENDAYYQLQDEAIEIEPIGRNHRCRIAETSDRVDQLLLTSRPLKILEHPDEITTWIDDLTYAHIRTFLEESSNGNPGLHKHFLQGEFKISSVPVSLSLPLDDKPANENTDLDDSKPEELIDVKPTFPVERPKNKKKTKKSKRSTSLKFDKP